MCAHSEYETCYITAIKSPEEYIVHEHIMYKITSAILSDIVFLWANSYWMPHFLLALMLLLRSLFLLFLFFTDFPFSLHPIPFKYRHHALCRKKCTFREWNRQLQHEHDVKMHLKNIQLILVCSDVHTLSQISSSNCIVNRIRNKSMTDK